MTDLAQGLTAEFKDLLANPPHNLTAFKDMDSEELLSFFSRQLIYSDAGYKTHDKLSKIYINSQFIVIHLCSDGGVIHGSRGEEEFYHHNGLAYLPSTNSDKRVSYVLEPDIWQGLKTKEYDTRSLLNVLLATLDKLGEHITP